MDVAEAAKLLDVSRPTLYRMIHAGRIRYRERQHVKRNRFLVSREDVERIVAAGEELRGERGPGAG